MKTILTDYIFTIDSFITEDNCMTILSQINENDFSHAPIVTSRGEELKTDIRKNKRIIFDDYKLSESLFNQNKKHFPLTLSGRNLIGLNEKFRIYKYSKNEYFKPHADTPYKRKNGELSLLSLLIYLNNDYKGGETKFDRIKVKGSTGMALVFHHGLIHEGSKVLEGFKYVLRTDVMFGKKLEK